MSRSISSGTRRWRSYGTREQLFLARERKRKRRKNFTDESHAVMNTASVRSRTTCATDTLEEQGRNDKREWASVSGELQFGLLVIVICERGDPHDSCRLYEYALIWLVVTDRIITPGYLTRKPKYLYSCPPIFFVLKYVLVPEKLGDTCFFLSTQIEFWEWTPLSKIGALYKYPFNCFTYKSGILYNGTNWKNFLTMRNEKYDFLKFVGKFLERNSLHEGSAGGLFHKKWNVIVTMASVTLKSVKEREEEPYIREARWQCVRVYAHTSAQTAAMPTVLAFSRSPLRCRYAWVALSRSFLRCRYA